MDYRKNRSGNNYDMEIGSEIDVSRHKSIDDELSFEEKLYRLKENYESRFIK